MHRSIVYEVLGFLVFWGQLHGFDRKHLITWDSHTFLLVSKPNCDIVVKKQLFSFNTQVCAHDPQPPKAHISLIDVLHQYTEDATPLNIINVIEQLKQCAMEYVCAQAIIVWNRVGYIARTVESEMVVDIDQENMSANRIAFPPEKMTAEAPLRSSAVKLLTGGRRAAASTTTGIAPVAMASGGISTCCTSLPGFRGCFFLYTQLPELEVE